MNKTTQSLLGAVLLVIALFTACRKEPYIPPIEAQPVVCDVIDYLFVVNASNWNRQLFGGFSVYRDDDEVYSYIDDNNLAYINYSFGRQYHGIDWAQKNYAFRLNSLNWPIEVRYTVNSDEIVLSTTYSGVGVLKEIEMDIDVFGAPTNDRLHIISDVVYENGDVVSYKYQEQMKLSPYTVYKTEYYQFEYDASKLYNKDAMVDHRMFSALNKSFLLLPQSYSFAELFDAQAFSLHLVTKKTNITSSEVMFTNAYQYDSRDNFTHCTQEFFPNNASKRASIIWNYTYDCE